MAPPKRPWFRYYVETFTDMDFRAMPYAHRLVWNAVMGLARSSPVAGALLDKASDAVTDAYLADFAAVKLSEAQAALRRFTALGWVRRDDGVLVVVNWDKRQFESDDVTSRTAKHRSRNADATPEGTSLGTAMERPSLTGSEVQSSQKVVTSTGESDVVRPSMALSLLVDKHRKSHGHEVDAIVATFAASHGFEAVELAVKAALDRIWPNTVAWPSDVKNLLAVELGPAPAPPQTHVLDETAAADRLRQAEGMAQVERLREEAKAVPDDPEERRRVLERVKARPA